ncbi:MAG: hypothetical protein E7I06_14180 [Enterococcus faecalis]|nr:hypothetical protein [Enterococcus faecalis]
MTVAISQKRGTANVVVTVFEALMLAIAFATLIVKISNKNDKK